MKTRHPSSPLTQDSGLRTRNSRPAFSLPELLIVLILLGAVTSMLGELFVITWRTNINSQKRDQLLHRVDSAVDLLRHDAWQARSIGLDGPRRVDIVLASGDAVTWRSTPEGALTRTALDANKTEQTRTWSALPPITFTSSGASGSLLTVSMHTAPGRDESLTLVSQQLLAGGAK